MAAQIDLFRLERYGTSVAAVVAGRHGPGLPQTHDWLDISLVVESSFASGTLELTVLPYDLADWEAAIDRLEAGEDAEWLCESGRTPELRIRSRRRRWSPLRASTPGATAYAGKVGG